MRDQIVHQIRSYIVEGALAPGTKLPSEQDFAALYNVSRPSIREAFVELHIRGYIEIQQGQSSYVLPWGGQPTSALCFAGPMELLQARIRIECRVAAEFAEIATSEEVNKLRNLVTAMQTSCCVTAHHELTRTFRRVLTSVTNQTVVGEIIDKLCVEMSARLLRTDDGAGLKVSHLEETSEHVKIVDAISRADGKAASRSMRAHLLGIAERLKEVESSRHGSMRLSDGNRLM